MRDLLMETEKKQIKIIIEHLIKECETDESLRNNIETKIKNTPLGMFKYIKDKAQKEAVDGCAMIEDSKVYEWAREYWNDYEEKEKVDNPVSVPKEDYKEALDKAIKTAIKETKEDKKKRELKDLYEDDLFGGEF